MSKSALGARLFWMLLFCASLALPTAAQARAGFTRGGVHLSIGSRGARTHEPGLGQPLVHTYTHTPTPAAGAGNLSGRSPFLTGLFGGFLGAALFRHGGLLGLGLILALLFVLWRARGRWFAGRRGAAPAMPGRGVDIALPASDLEAFQKLHAAIQEAWSNADLARLSQLVTPEMLRWFSGELARNAAAGVRNVVSGVTLVKGELTESWEERDRQYATAFLRWRAFDYRVPLDRSTGERDFLAAGDPRVPVETEEVWTFMRRRGGPWLLSAIQQV
jgi:hypothetical protein